MVKISTLFYVLDDIEERSGKIFNLDDYQEDEETEFTDIFEMLDRLQIEVDQRLVDRLIKMLPEM